MEGWRQWHSAGQKPCATKKEKSPLDSDRPSHGRRLHSKRGMLGGPASRRTQPDNLNTASGARFPTRVQNHVQDRVEVNDFSRSFTISKRVCFQHLKKFDSH